jgi:molybdopterin converting factor small subunit
VQSKLLLNDFRRGTSKLLNIFSEYSKLNVNALAAIFMKVLFFAQAREVAGCGDYFLKIEKPMSESEFWIALVDVFPGLASQQKTARLARRETYLQKNELLHPDDEIAVIPPVSGG